MKTRLTHLVGCVTAFALSNSLGTLTNTEGLLNALTTIVPSSDHQRISGPSRVPRRFGRAPRAQAQSRRADPRSRRVSFAGVNIAGFDHGCTIDGACNITSIVNVADDGGIEQMAHFVRDDGLNTFRLPVSWQFLTDNVLGGELDRANFEKYDRLVRGCIAVGASMCIIDIHNYARWYSAVIGQSGVSNNAYTALLTSLAWKYKNDPQIAFGLMNEPHDLDVKTWASTVQLAVTAIRAAGARSNPILLPGSTFASAGAFRYESGPYLLGIRNPDGSTRGLVFDVHQYNDADFTGTHVDCVTDNIARVWQPLAQWLRQNDRQALITETGGGARDPTCLRFTCQQMDFINRNADVYRGVTTWAAGGWWSDYELNEVPSKTGNQWVDVPLVEQCVVDKFRGADGLW